MGGKTGRTETQVGGGTDRLAGAVSSVPKNVNTTSINGRASVVCWNYRHEVHD